MIITLLKFFQSRTIHFIFIIWAISGYFVQAQSQNSSSFRIHVQPGVYELKGDGDDSTTLVVTARDEEGQLIRVDGKVVLEVNAGFVTESELLMKDGIAETTFKSPILDNESLVFKRSMELTMLAMQSVMGMSKEEVTASDGKARMMKKMMESVRKGPNASSMTTIKGKDPIVRIVASMKDKKGKAEIRILEGKIEETGLKSGVYEGKDVTGQSSWKMTIETKGRGFEGTIITQGAPMSIMSEGETKAGFLIVYLYDERELKQLRKGGFAKDFKGFPTAMKLLPGKTIYMVAPPVYMTWKRDINRSPGRDDSQYETYEEVSKAALIPRQNMMPGDGKSKVEVAFIYRDKKGKPVSGKTVNLSLMRGGMGGKLNPTSGVTDNHGVFKTTYYVPEYKTDDIQKLGTCKKEILYADFKEDKETERVCAEIGILCCTDAELIIEKPGFDDKYVQKVIVDSPWGEFSGKLTQPVQESYITTQTVELPIFDAECRLRGGALVDMEYALKTKSDKKGKFKIELSRKNWPVYRVMNPEIKPLRFSKSHEHRKKEIKADSIIFPDMEFRHHLYGKIVSIEKNICIGDRELAEAEENKLQLLGDITAITVMSDKLIGDTADEVMGHGWSLIGALFNYANSKFKFTKSIDDRLEQANSGVNSVLFGEEKGSVGRILFVKLRKIFDKNAVLGRERNTVILRDDINSKIFGELVKVLGELVNKLATLQKWPENPVKGFIKSEISLGYRSDVQSRVKYVLDADSLELNSHFESLQPWMVRHSGYLRDHYLNISGWRLSVEDAKAFKDLTVDFIAISAAVIMAAGGNVHALETWKKLKECSEKLDNVIAASGFVLEIWNIAQIRAESLALFDKAVSCCGKSQKTAHANDDTSWQKVVYAQEGKSNFTIPPSLNEDVFSQLESKSGIIPMSKFSSACRSIEQWREWEANHQLILFLAQSQDSGKASELNEMLDVLDSTVLTMKLMILEQNTSYLSESRLKEWNEYSESLEDLADKINSLSNRIYQKGLKGYQEYEHITSLESSAPVIAGDQSGSMKSILLVGVALIAGTLCVIVVIILLRNKTKHRRKKISSQKQVEHNQNDKGDRLLLPDNRLVQLTEAVMNAGSAPDNHIVLPWQGVEQYHARFCYSSEHNNWWVEILDNQYQVGVNGEIGTSFWLTDGCQISLGTATVLFLR